MNWKFVKLQIEKEKTVRKYLLIFTFFAIVRPVFATETQDMINECWKDHSHVEMTECLDVKLKLSETALADSEKNIVKHIKERQEEPEDIKRAVEAFVEGQSAFKSYRKKQCDFNAATAFGGNGGHDLRLACQIQLNYQRSKGLAEIADRTGE